MIRLVRPDILHEEQYKDMIKEWKQFGGPYVPWLIDYDCNRSIEQLDYSAFLNVVDNYSSRNVLDCDIDYYDSSDFYFIFNDEELVGMGEVRHNLKSLGKKTIGHIACGIRPSQRKKGYALEATRLMMDKLKETGIEEVILCHYSENVISPKIIRKLGFQFRDSVISEVSKKEIKCYIKKENNK